MRFYRATVTAEEDGSVTMRWFTGQGMACHWCATVENRQSAKVDRVELDDRPRRGFILDLLNREKLPAKVTPVWNDSEPTGSAEEISL